MMESSVCYFNMAKNGSGVRRPRICMQKWFG